MALRKSSLLAFALGALLASGAIAHPLRKEPHSGPDSPAPTDSFEDPAWGWANHDQQQNAQIVDTSGPNIASNVPDSSWQPPELPPISGCGIPSSPANAVYATRASGLSQRVGVLDFAVSWSRSSQATGYRVCWDLIAHGSNTDDYLSAVICARVHGKRSTEYNNGERAAIGPREGVNFTNVRVAAYNSACDVYSEYTSAALAEDGAIEYACEPLAGMQVPQGGIAGASVMDVVLTDVVLDGRVSVTGDVSWQFVVPDSVDVANARALLCIVQVTGGAGVAEHRECFTSGPGDTTFSFSVDLHPATVAIYATARNINSCGAEETSGSPRVAVEQEYVPWGTNLVNTLTLCLGANTGEMAAENNNNNAGGVGGDVAGVNPPDLPSEVGLSGDGLSVPPDTSSSADAGGPVIAAQPDLSVLSQAQLMTAAPTAVDVPTIAGNTAAAGTASVRRNGPAVVAAVGNHGHRHAAVRKAASAAHNGRDAGAPMMRRRDGVFSATSEPATASAAASVAISVSPSVSDSPTTTDSPSAQSPTTIQPGSSGSQPPLVYTECGSASVIETKAELDPDGYPTGHFVTSDGQCVIVLYPPGALVPTVGLGDCGSSATGWVGWRKNGVDNDLAGRLYVRDTFSNMCLPFGTGIAELGAAPQLVDCTQLVGAV